MKILPYQDMTDRELIIKLFGKLEHLECEMADIKDSIKNRPCPGELCKDHAHALVEHESRLDVIDAYVKLLGGGIVLMIGSFGTYIISLFWR